MYYKKLFLFLALFLALGCEKEQRTTLETRDGLNAKEIAELEEYAMSAEIETVANPLIEGTKMSDTHFIYFMNTNTFPTEYFYSRLEGDDCDGHNCHSHSEWVPMPHYDSNGYPFWSFKGLLSFPFSCQYWCDDIDSNGYRYGVFSLREEDGVLEGIIGYRSCTTCSNTDADYIQLGTGEVDYIYFIHPDDADSADDEDHIIISSTRL